MPIVRERRRCLGSSRQEVDMENPNHLFQQSLLYQRWSRIGVELYVVVVAEAEQFCHALRFFQAALIRHLGPNS